MGTESERTEELVDSKGVKRDEKGRVRFRTLEKNKSGTSSDDE